MSLFMFKMAVVCVCFSIIMWILILFSVSRIDSFEIARMKAHRDVERTHPALLTIIVVFALLVLFAIVFACIAAVMWLFGA